jgi:SAM-dependent methyltransferase
MNQGTDRNNTEFSDPRLVAIYDVANAYDPDAQPGFYTELADELGAESIIDFGCGTGIITCELARRGFRVIGVDPAPAMLAVARQKLDAEGVTWIEGDAGSVGTPGADFVIMSGHVAQFFLTDDSWRSALSALRGALRPGGHLAFETRNPEVREWESWTPDRRRIVHHPTLGAIERWPEVHNVRAGIVSYTIHNLFHDTGEDVMAPTRLRFLSRAKMEGSLADAGFSVGRVYGDWDRRPADPTTRELIFVAAS